MLPTHEAAILHNLAAAASCPAPAPAQECRGSQGSPSHSRAGAHSFRRNYLTRESWPLICVYDLYFWILYTSLHGWQLKFEIWLTNLPSVFRPLLCSKQTQATTFDLWTLTCECWLYNTLYCKTDHTQLSWDSSMLHWNIPMENNVFSTSKLWKL